jgi:polysaccharide export outer membrane protein
MPNSRTPIVIRVVSVAAALALGCLTTTDAAGAQQSTPGVAKNGASLSPELKQDLPPEYVVGAADHLSIVFFHEKEMSADVQVRPDGFISLPLINELHVAGLTPEALRSKVTEAAKRYVNDPTVSVIIKQINSRNVFITGEVAKPGAYPLNGPLTVLQLIAIAGGVLEYSDSKNVVILRSEQGKQISFPFNYKDVVKRKNLSQNIELKPGDAVIVP